MQPAHHPLPRQIAWLIAAGLAVLAGAVPEAEVRAATPQPRAITPRGELPATERATIDLFERARGSVVHISTSRRVVDFWTRNVLSIPRGTGSGFIWDEQPNIVTNYHVIAGAAEARVRLNDGREYPASLVGASPAHDIAVLRIKVPSNRPPPLPLGSSHDLRVGQRVFAIGNPFGLDWSLSTGIVSALDRSLANDSGSIEHLIQTDAAINPGNSGGPLLDSAGRLIGMNTAIFSPSGANAGVGFAVPADTVNRVVPELIAYGKYRRPELGIAMDEGITGALSEKLGVEGVPVLRVTPRSPAAAAGLLAARVDGEGNFVPGDFIVAIEGRPVTTVAKLLARLDDFTPGDKVKLTILRDGRRLTLEVQLTAG
ncbi:MAG: trypsin-like peptidase domain-containing protein [Betaproteobacteria bacterium]|nr:trypsin-like peptidase domain-containing protein [Betaproteobacteria bacterium]